MNIFIDMIGPSAMTMSRVGIKGFWLLMGRYRDEKVNNDGLRVVYHSGEVVRLFYLSTAISNGVDRHGLSTNGIKANRGKFCFEDCFLYAAINISYFAVTRWKALREYSQVNEEIIAPRF